MNELQVTHFDPGIFCFLNVICRTERLTEKINNCNVPATRARMQKECKNIKKQVASKVKEAEENEIDRQMKHLEQISDDNIQNTTMF